MRKTGLYLLTAVSLIILSAAMSDASDLFGELKQSGLDNGLEVITVQDDRLPLVYISLISRGGSAVDPPDKAGRAELAAMMLKTGSKSRSGEEISAIVDSVGGKLNSKVTREFSILTGNFLSQDIALALELIGDMVLNPGLDSISLEQLIRRQKSTIMQIRSEAGYPITSKLFKSFYPSGGYGEPTYGTIRGIENVSVNDIENYFDTYYVPNNCALIVVGDFDRDKVTDMIQSSFGNWSGEKKSPYEIEDPVLPDTTHVILLNRTAEANTSFVIGHPASPAGSEDFPYLMMLNYLIGGGGKLSRLHQSVVAEQGLALSLSSDLTWSRHDGMFIVRGTAPHSMAADAVNEALTVIEASTKMKIPADEINDAANFYRGYLPIAVETYAGLSSALVELWAFKAELDYFDRLIKSFAEADPERLRKIAEKYLRTREMYIIVAGPAEQLKPSLNQIGSVEIIDSRLE